MGGKTQLHDGVSIKYNKYMQMLFFEVEVEFVTRYRHDHLKNFCNQLSILEEIENIGKQSNNHDNSIPRDTYH